MLQDLLDLSNRSKRTNGWHPLRLTLVRLIPSSLQQNSNLGRLSSPGTPNYRQPQLCACGLRLELFKKGCCPWSALFLQLLLQLKPLSAFSVHEKMAIFAQKPASRLACAFLFILNLSIVESRPKPDPVTAHCPPWVTNDPMYDPANPLCGVVVSHHSSSSTHPASVHTVTTTVYGPTAGTTTVHASGSATATVRVTAKQLYRTTTVYGPSAGTHTLLPSGSTPGTVYITDKATTKTTTLYGPTAGTRTVLESGTVPGTVYITDKATTKTTTLYGPTAGTRTVLESGTIPGTVYITDKEVTRTITSYYTGSWLHPSHVGIVLC